MLTLHLKMQDHAYFLHHSALLLLMHDLVDGSFCLAYITRISFHYEYTSAVRMGLIFLKCVQCKLDIAGNYIIT